MKKSVSIGSSLVVTEPVYKQLLRVCRAGIESGRYQADDQFPSERDLSKLYGVSRATANKVLSSMVAENLLVHRPGIGTFVSGARSLHASLRAMESFTDRVRAEGFVPSTRVLQFREQAEQDWPAGLEAELSLQRGEKVFFIERQRLADGEPVLLEWRWIRAALVPKLKSKDLKGSFYEILERRFALALTGEKYRIRAEAVNAETAVKLGVKRGAATLVVEGIGYVRPEQPLWKQILFYRGDKYELDNFVLSQKSQASTELALIRNLI
jgi:DNA-binding GntR family transcriptional regulator